MSAKIYLEHGYYDDATNTWHTGPSAVLKALEEQAPEILRKYCAKQLADICGLEYDEMEEQLELHEQSPWIRVSDESPPKDGSVIGETEDGEYIVLRKKQTLTAGLRLDTGKMLRSKEVNDE